MGKKESKKKDSIKRWRKRNPSSVETLRRVWSGSWGGQEQDLWKYLCMALGEDGNVRISILGKCQDC